MKNAKWSFRLVAVGDQPVAEVVDVVVQQRIVHHHVQRTHLAQHRSAVILRFLRRDQRVGRAAQVGQAHVFLRAGGARQRGGDQAVSRRGASRRGAMIIGKRQ
jgi:hypothetical protein